MIFVMVFCPETSYNSWEVKFENFCFQPYLCRDFSILYSLVH